MNELPRILIRKGLMLCLAFFCGVQGGQAHVWGMKVTDNSGAVNVTIKGVVVTPPPCTINNNVTIDVNFGDAVDINKVDGNNYLTDVPYTVECTGNSSNNLNLSIQGNGADFDSSVLDGGHNGLGIELVFNDKKLSLGDNINFTWSSSTEVPVIKAVPVKKSGATLSTGEFSVGATIVVSFQ